MTVGHRESCREITAHNFGRRPYHLLTTFIPIRSSFLRLLSVSTIILQFIAVTVSQDLDSTYYHVGCYTQHMELFKESMYARSPQSCIEICDRQSLTYAILNGDRCYCTNHIEPKDRQDDQLCNKRCTANKLQYCGGVGVLSFYAIIKGDNGRIPPNLRVTEVRENSVSIGWDVYEPYQMHTASAKTIFGSRMGASSQPSLQPITNFLIKPQLVHTYSSLPLYSQPEFIVQSTETSFEINDLHPATEYNITVRAICNEIVCGSNSVSATTEVGKPNPPPPQPRILSNSDTTIKIQLPIVKNDNGPISKLLVIVERVDNALSQEFDESLLGSWTKAQNDGLPYYIAAQLDYDRMDENRKHEFVVGDGKRYGPYTNPPLENKDGHIHVSLGVVSTLNGITKTLYTRADHDQHTITMENFTYTTFNSGLESIIALSITCIIFGTCLVLSVIAYVYLRYKTYQAHSGTARLRNTHEMTLQQPIIERENNGFVIEDELPSAENFKQQMSALVDSLEPSKRLSRSMLRMNVNDILAEGRYGEVISGRLINHAAPQPELDCQLHVMALDDLTAQDQAHLLQEFRKLSQLQRHEHILDFYGISASADWFYFVLEYQAVSLKRRLIESRRAPNSAPIQRSSALSEQLILQWIYELSTALEHLNRLKIVHKQLCSHSIMITADARLKLSAFGPVPFVNNQKKVDLTRWLAPETLRYQHYSIKSDIWSFGVVAWECCTLGATPYANIMSNHLLLDAIKSGSRPAQPPFVYQDLYQLLLNCWQLESSERSNLEDIAFNIRQLMTSPRHALSFDRLPEPSSPAGNNVLDILPYYLPMLEMIN